MKFSTSLCVIVLFLAFFNAACSAQNFEVGTDEFTVSVTGNGNVPKYEFWLNDDSGEKYNVQWDKMYEVLPGSDSNIGSTSVSFSSLDWDWSPVEVDSNGNTVFSFTGTFKKDDKAKFESFQVVNYLSNETNPESTRLKFDIVIRGYDWEGEDSNELVVLVKFQDKSDKDAPEQEDGDNNNTIENGDAFLSSSATANNGAVDVVLGARNSAGVDKGASFRYTHFASNLDHDPTFGVNASAGILSISSFFLVLSALVLAFVM